MTKEDIVNLTNEIAAEFEVIVDKIIFGKRSALGTAIVKKDGSNRIVYNRCLLERPEWDIKHIIYHEVAHIVTHKRYGGGAVSQS